MTGKEEQKVIVQIQALLVYFWLNSNKKYILSLKWLAILSILFFSNLSHAWIMSNTFVVLCRHTETIHHLYNIQPVTLGLLAEQRQCCNHSTWMPLLHVVPFSMHGRKHTRLSSKLKDIFILCLSHMLREELTAVCENGATPFFPNPSSELWPLTYNYFPLRMLHYIFNSVKNKQLFPFIFCQEMGRANCLCLRSICVPHYVKNCKLCSSMRHLLM